MKRFALFILILILASTAVAQETPPIASLITISEPDETGMVTISGSNGTVPVNSYIVIRNLYTKDTAYTRANFQGAFTADIYGAGSTPFWISPSESQVADDQRAPDQVLLGGPGTIVYSESSAPTNTIAITRLLLDANLDDWDTYTQADVGQGVLALANQESLYLALTHNPNVAEFEQLQITFSLDNASYQVTLNPHLAQTSLIRQLTPREENLGTIRIANRQENDILELRIPYKRIGEDVASIQLQQIEYIGSDGEILRQLEFDNNVSIVDELNGVLYKNPLLEEGTPFYIGGRVQEKRWDAWGKVNQQALQPTDELILELNFRMDNVTFADSLVGIQLVGELGFQPITDASGLPISGGLHSNNGWSAILTNSGLPIDNIRSDFILVEAVTEPQNIFQREDDIFFGMQFRVQLPEDIPDGTYAPTFRGYLQTGDSERVLWEDSILFDAGSELNTDTITRLPLILTIGETQPSQLLWTLFDDTTSNGSRGIIPQEMKPHMGLSNRVQFNSSTYILPLDSYSLEPSLPALLPNNHTTTLSPLIPFSFPSGELEIEILLPDGTVDDLGRLPMAQNKLSTSTFDETILWGENIPINLMKLTSLDGRLEQYAFEQYGEYEIRLRGEISDIWGNLYQGGGTYSVLIAELLDFTPSVMLGTPFEVGNYFTPAGHFSPNVAAEIDVTLQVFLLNGEVITQEFSGTANRFGFFATDEYFQFTEAGEYIVDYEARYTDAEGRLWASSTRSAGVIAHTESSLILHGQRGLAIDSDDIQPPWYDTFVYPPNNPQSQTRAYNPYYSGDVVWIPDTDVNGIVPTLYVQDTLGNYEKWLFDTHHDLSISQGSLLELIQQDSLPLVSVLGGADPIYTVPMLPNQVVNRAYSYFSAVRPDVTVRQFVQGGYDNLSFAWNENAPLNNQIGVGRTGSRDGDFTFLFGGAVVQNAEANVQETAIYASISMTANVDSRVQVYPPHNQSGFVSQPLMEVLDEEIFTFFHPTGLRPGQIFALGDPFVIAGQAAPPLKSSIYIELTAPSGEVYTISDVSNSIGYFYNPDNTLIADEIGVWRVELTIEQAGVISTGQLEPPFPQGSVLGTENHEFFVYVVPEDVPALVWDRSGTTIIPRQTMLPFNSTLTIPATWTNTQLYRTITTPSYLLSHEVIDHLPPRYTSQYNLINFRDDFPNFETGGRGIGASSSDVVTITFAVTGRDENEEFAIRTRTFTLMHDTAFTIEAVEEE